MYKKFFLRDSEIGEEGLKKFKVQNVSIFLFFFQKYTIYSKKIKKKKSQRFKKVKEVTKEEKGTKHKKVFKMKMKKEKSIFYKKNIF